MKILVGYKWTIAYGHAFKKYVFLFLGSLIIHENQDGKRGLQTNLIATCSSCEGESSLETSFNVSGRGKCADINRRAVYYSIETGGGYASLGSFCSIMNMPCMSKSSYYQHLETILVALEAEAQDEMKQAGERLRERIIKENGCEDKSSVVDAAVSFDGTWAKRGFTSLTGVVFVISVDNGEVLDYHVVSKSCQKCSLKRSKCKTDEGFEEWEVEHVFSG